jgi:hypothetical protein
LTEPTDVDLLAAALRADRADLEVYAEVLTVKLVGALPEGLVRVDRRRTLADRMAGRPGTVTAITVSAGDRELTLRQTGHGLQGLVEQAVRGVVIARREVPVDEWLRALAEALTGLARQSERARAALGRLLRPD